MVLIKVNRNIVNKQTKNATAKELSAALLKTYEVKTLTKIDGKYKGNVLYLPKCFMGKKVTLSIVLSQKKLK